MKHGFKKILCAALGATMILGLAACNSSSNDTTPAPTTVPDTSSTAGADTSTTPAPATSGEPVTLKFWNIWGQSDANNAAVTQVISDFEAANPNITIDTEYFENDAYKTMIKTTVAGDEAPDVFSTWGAGFSQPFVDAGKVVNLDQYLQDGTLDKLNGGALDYYTYNGSVYGLTFGKAASGFFVNTDAFTKSGATLPTTWDELLAACDKLKAGGFVPIITSSKDIWVSGMLFEGIVTKAVGTEMVNKTIGKEDGGSFSDPRYLDAIDRLGTLIDNGYINSDAAAISRDEALASFENGDAGLYYMGQWECSALEGDDSAIKGKVDWIPFPTLPGGAAATEFNGGCIDGLMVSSGSAHPAEAAAFVKYFCENLSRVGYQMGNYMPAWNTSNIDESQIPAVFAKIANATKDATGYVIWWDTFLTGDDVTNYQDALDKYMNKTITDTDFQAVLEGIQP